MPVTVREVVDLEPLRSAGPRVLAGTVNLDRAVRWVHVAELPDIAHLLQGGELLLTTGLGMAGTPAAQRRYVDELADAGAAGVVVELGRTFDAVPAALVEAADAHGLPLVSLDRETRFVEVTEIVHREILSRQYDLLDRAEQVSRELADQILDGADARTLVAHLGTNFATTVVFEDAAGHAVATSGPRGADGGASTWERHARLRHAGPSSGSGRSGAVHRAPSSDPEVPGCAWVDLWIRHERWGRLHVLDAATTGRNVDELLVDRAGAALALAMLSEKDAAHLVERAGDALIGEIVAGRHGSGDETLRRARSLGADLAGGRLAAAALEVRPTAAAHGLTDGARLELLRSLTVALRAAVAQRGCSALVGTSGDRVIAIVAIPGTRPVAGVLEDLVEAASALIDRRGGTQLVAGASGPASKDALHRAVEEATVAAGFARVAGPGRRVHHFAELGTYQLLLRLADGPELARFVDSELHPLVERDRAGKPRLIPTLRAYLAHAGRKADAARELGVQRRTLYQRLARIEALLGRSLDEQATRTRLTLALQGLDFLARRSGHA
ncbi:MAG: PucR family transcriptional regulator [Actinomycetota bacterium]|nr:PucR family transcriptional regulator [Actinomycetota bacterium]